MAKSIKKVRHKLQLSHLAGQRQLLSTDIDLSQIAFITRRLPTMRFDQAVVSGEINRTIEGASTVVINVNDHWGLIRKSGRLGKAVDIKLDGLWFRLCKVRKTGDNLQLTFESREIAVLRTYNERRVVGWGKMRRARFCQILVQEVKEFKIPFHCPDLETKKKTKDKDKKLKDRDLGFDSYKEPKFDAPGKLGLTIKGAKASRNQLANIEEVLDVGTGMALIRKLLVTSVMTVIQESSANNLPYGDRDSVGMFQQRPSQGWKGLQNIPKAAEEYFTRAQRYNAGNPKSEYWEVCQAVQRSAYPKAYAAHRKEAERIVTAYGVAGGDLGTDGEVDDANLMSTVTPTDIDKFQFTRGRTVTKPGGREAWEKEDSWSCLQRLADEVNWRCFEVSGEIYFTTETHLFKSSPRARISENSQGIDYIDWDYDVGKRESTVEVTARIDRWRAAPGTVIEIHEQGPVNGRWLVVDYRRSLFDPLARITLKKPEARLPEAKKEDMTGLWDNQIKSPGDAYVPTPGYTQREGTSLKNSLGSGANGVADALFDIAAEAGGSGVYVGSDLRSQDKLPSGSYSDHAENNEFRAARDIGVKGIDLLVGPPSPKLDKGAAAIGDALGKKWTGKSTIIEDVDFHGFRIQVIWRTPKYGGHMGHIHVGVRDKTIPATRLSAGYQRPG